MQHEAMPTYQDLLWPTLKAIEGLGGSALNEELSDELPQYLNLPDEVFEIPHKEGPLTEVDYRAGWARSNLKLIGAVDNSERGVWSITDFGRKISSEEELKSLVQAKRAERYRATRLPSAPTEEVGDEPIEDELAWEEQLLSAIRKIDPAAFERLCQRLLRESGLTNVEVTGKSGDGGIDGTGVLRVNLLSFHVRFQSKRYSGSVGPKEIRDFRGAMVGRADKGLFITTGRYTKDAKREAVRDGAPAIDLIDGQELCHLLKERKIGVRTELVEQVHIDEEFLSRL